MPRFVRGVEQSSYEREYNQDRLRLSFEIVEADWLPSHRLGTTPSTVSYSILNPSTSQLKPFLFEITTI
jgi:hypothetical protein